MHRLATASLLLVVLASGAAAADEPVGPILNEIELNPPGNDEAFEYIELRGPPGLQLAAATYVVCIDGDGNAAGEIDKVFDVSNQSFGGNGIIVIHAASGGHTMPAAATSIIDERFAGIGILENGSQTFALVTSATAPLEGSDLDSDDDGTIDVGGVIFLDSIGWVDGDPGDHVYGPASLNDLGFVPGAMTRFVDDFDAQTPAAWFGGTMGGTSTDSVMYTPGPMGLTVNFPAGAMLTPGAPNDLMPGQADAGPVEPDAGSGEQADAGTTQSDDDAGGCGCSVGARTGTGVVGGVLLGLGLAGLVIGRRKRR
jgi:hypothetical protein